MATQPDMTQQYTAELKKLSAELSKDEKRTARSLASWNSQRTSALKEADRDIKKIRRIADRDIRRTQAALKKRDRALCRTITTIERARNKRTAALERRIDVLQGRLGS